MGLRPLEICFTFTVRVSTLESDVYRRQILSTKVDPRAVRDTLRSVVTKGVKHRPKKCCDCCTAPNRSNQYRFSVGPQSLALAQHR